MEAMTIETCLAITSLVHVALSMQRMLPEKGITYKENHSIVYIKFSRNSVAFFLISVTLKETQKLKN